MKAKLNIVLISVIALFFTFSACEKEEEFDYKSILPAKIGVTGPSTVFTNGGNAVVFKVTSLRGGSSYTWTVDGAQATITGQGTYMATIVFPLPATDIDGVKVTVQETTYGGLSGDAVTLTLNLKKVCSLTGKAADLVGAWGGTDAGYGSKVTSTASGDDVVLSGLNADWILGSWGETILSGGTCTMKVNYEEGNVTIPLQFLFKTDYKGSSYDYTISGSGTWNNCGANPTLSIQYHLVNTTDGYSLDPYTDNGKYFEAELELGVTKGAFVVKRAKIIRNK